MTDTMLLLSCMKCKRITLGYAAGVLGISSSTLRYKINNDRDFKVSEVDKLCHLLGLNRDQRHFHDTAAAPRYPQRPGPLRPAGIPPDVRGPRLEPGH